MVINTIKNVTIFDGGGRAPLIFMMDVENKKLKKFITLECILNGTATTTNAFKQKTQSIEA
jgi:hypothetical protein